MTETCISVSLALMKQRKDWYLVDFYPMSCILEKSPRQKRAQTFHAFLLNNHKTGTSNSAGMNTSLYDRAFELNVLKKLNYLAPVYY